MSRLFAWLWLMLGSIAAAGVHRAQADVPQVFLIQNSGWMEPFFVDLDKTARFADTVNAFISGAAGAATGSSAQPASKIIIASFNQDGQLPDRPSPHKLYEDEYSSDKVAAAIAQIDLPYKKPSIFTDADYFGALSGAAGRLLRQEPGIIWMITNNKNSRDNSQEIQENTRKFGVMLRDSPYIRRTVAYAIRMHARGKRYDGRSIVIYGLAYGSEEADKQLAAIADRKTPPTGDQPNSLYLGMFKDPPARLKPLDTQPVRFTADAMLSQGGVEASTTEDGSIIFQDIPIGTPISITIRGKLASSYYPHVIDAARVNGSWLRGDEDTATVDVSIAPEILPRMRPTQDLVPFAITFNLPPFVRAPGSSDWLRGTLRLRLSDMKLSLWEDFQSKFDEVDGLSQLPEVFGNYQKVGEASTDVPVLFRLADPETSSDFIWLVPVALAGLGLAYVSTKLRHRYPVQVGNTRMFAEVMPFRSVILREPGSQARAQVTGRLFGEPKVRPLPPE